MTEVILGEDVIANLTIVNNSLPDVPIRPFEHFYLWEFNMNDQRFKLKETFDGFLQYMNEQGINYAWVLAVNRLLFFTEEKHDFDALIVKLTTTLTLLNDYPFDLAEKIKSDMQLDILKSLDDEYKIQCQNQSPWNSYKYSDDPYDYQKISSILDR